MHKILLVDDEPIFSEYLKGLLDWSDYGCQVCGMALDGDHAWELIQQLRPDIVLLDINIPGPDGLEICRRLRQENIPCEVIIISAHDDFYFAKTAFRYGIVDYLLKPFDRDEFIQVLERSIGQLQQKKSAQQPTENPLLVHDSMVPYSDLQQPGRLSKRGELADRINRYIEKNYMQKHLTVDKIAAALNFENSYIRRIYKNESGTTILRAIEDYRIQKAKELLAQRSMRHSEIATAVGFNDQYYFSKRFKQIVGCTPTEYEVLISNVE